MQQTAAVRLICQKHEQVWVDASIVYYKGGSMMKKLPALLEYHYDEACSIWLNFFN